MAWRIEGLVFRSWFAIAAIASALGTCWGQERWVFGGIGGRPWEEVAELNALGDVTTTPGALHPWELLPDENLIPRISGRFEWSLKLEPENPFWAAGMPRFWRSNRDASLQMSPISNFIDGDPYTLNSALAHLHTGSEFYTFDLGGLVPLERFVIRLPLEFDLEMGEPDPRCCDRAGRPFSLYVPHQGVLTAERTETAEIRLGLPGYRPLGIHLKEVKGQLVAPLEIGFPLQQLRFLRWRSIPDGKHPARDRPWFEALAYGEMEVYGRGFAGAIRLRSQVQDLGRPFTVGRVATAVSRWRRQGSRWIEVGDAEGETRRQWQAGDLVAAPDAPVTATVHLRNGTDHDPNAYWTFSDAGELMEVDRTEWDLFRDRGEFDPRFIGWKGPVTDDFENWTPWSFPIRQSVFEPDMPSRRFFQLEIVLETSEPAAMARLDSLSIDFFPLLASTLLGEIGSDDGRLRGGLIEVPLGRQTEFVYAIRAEFPRDQPGEGFDVVRIATPSAARFLYLLMGESMEASEEVIPVSVSTDVGTLTLLMPDPVRADEILWIGMETALYTVSSEMRSEVFNRESSHAWQRVEAGDATDEIGTNGLAIVADGLDPERVVDALEIVPTVFTPNGDGVNDDTRIDFTLFGVLDAEVQVSFFTLAGKRVGSIAAAGLAAGVHRFAWDGRNEAGDVLAPGLYLCRVRVETGRGSFGVEGSLALAY